VFFIKTNGGVFDIAIEEYLRQSEQTIKEQRIPIQKSQRPVCRLGGAKHYDCWGQKYVYLSEKLKK
jgi:hypothetical protein